MKRLFVLALALACVPATLPAQDAAPAAVEDRSADAWRFVELEGGRNFRDLGGYRTADGQVMRRGLVYRSGSLGSLTLAGQQRLAGLHLTSIIDLRATDERARDMNNWLAASGQGYWSRDYQLSLGDMGAMMRSFTQMSPDELRATMAATYPKMLREQAPSYRVLFERLVEGKGPVAFNCTAGKDRTGIASALVLSVLGVPYDTVRADFLLSNGAPGMRSLSGALPPQMASASPEVLRILGGVEGQYLDAAFDAIRQDYGSVEGYLQTELGVGPQQVARLRARLLSAPARGGA